jgi:hypothetical protein
VLLGQPAGADVLGAREVAEGHLRGLVVGHPPTVATRSIKAGRVVAIYQECPNSPTPRP